MTQTDRDAENGRDREKDREKEQQRGVKRPIMPAAVPEPVQEQIQANFIVVIHPGSRTLRLGRATDTLPISVPHVIARRHKHPGQSRYEDKCLLREGLNSADSNEQRQNGLKMVDQVIWSKKMSNGVRRTPVSAEQARLYNRQIRPAVLDPNSKVSWTNTSHHPEYVVGEEALYVNPTDCYSVHWPVCRGRLNLHSGSGGSLSAVMMDLEHIWTHALQKLLQIPLKDLKYYRCILLIPDIYNRQHVKEIVNMLLVKMGFSAVVVHQESVCATFGSGLSSACVVDVGDQKTSVCCVEDGVSHRSSRLCLAYGGSDVTRCFFWLMQRAGFPYRDCQLGNKLDCVLLQQLKESFCHLDQDISGLQDHEFRTRFPDSPVLLYQLRLGDEKLQAPMTLFYPAAFGIVGQRMTSLLHRSQGDAEDPHDEHFLLTTQSKQDQSSKASADRKSFPKPSSFEGESSVCEVSDRSSLGQDLDLGHSQAECLVGGAETEETPSALLSRKTAMSQFEGKALGIDKAILHSIDSCASDETKRKMYSCILVVGGGLLFHGAQEFLQHRILNKMPPSFRCMVESVDVITRPKDTDARVCVWKGGSVLACLDTTQELWIHQREWQRFGVRMLRERAAFVW
ncbi:actin-related protein 8 [Danio rerio]|uniref:Actin-related protein 8 n=1 Tax=Danio rerio TaxID=7955 RepID=ARP8_DANRE|nr:actin-related protein 8 [Danio rerio]P59679.1 RecName: Full=Actin-related protein 8 [Danio rerio]AAH44364.1 ARP8 actin-related protein 8 homolog (yeast) [Danio rerio]|eukprot:NP_001001400.1 actin-related protein 8 [Danio rerio]